jgi:hypothetical protein
MKSAIDHPADDKYELVVGLIKLFNEIDINGDAYIYLFIYFKFFLKKFKLCFKL